MALRVCISMLVSFKWSGCQRFSACGGLACAPDTNVCDLSGRVAFGGSQFAPRRRHPDFPAEYTSCFGNEGSLERSEHLELFLSDVNRRPVLCVLCVVKLLCAVFPFR